MFMAAGLQVIQARTEPRPAEHAEQKVDQTNQSLSAKPLAACRADPCMYFELRGSDVITTDNTLSQDPVQHLSQNGSATSTEPHQNMKELRPSG